jgi:hypothetical protein
MAYVYKHTKTKNNEIFYIGISGNDKNLKRAYRKERNYLWNKIVSKEEYRIDIIISGISWEEACKIEKELIKYYGKLIDNTGNLSNLTDGGEGTPGRIRPLEEVLKYTGEKNGSFGKKWVKKDSEEKMIPGDLLEKYIEDGWTRGRIITDEQRKKMSDSCKGRKLSEETKRKLGLKSKGHIKSDEERRKRSASLKGRIPWNKGILNYKNLSDEEKNLLKISRVDLKTLNS